MSEPRDALGALLELMARLRDPERGCPWDRQQSFASIAPYTIEEAYEVADAIERGDREHLRDELGDLLFQVVFHARMAEERGWFDFAQVAAAIHDKLVRRHPHVFAGTQPTPEELVRVWEEQKAGERAAARGGAAHAVLADVPRALPALTRAAKLSRRAAACNRTPCSRAHKSARSSCWRHRSSGTFPSSPTSTRRRRRIRARSRLDRSLRGRSACSRP